MTAQPFVLHSGSSLDNNPRVAKQAAALCEADFAVVVQGIWITVQGAKVDALLEMGFRSYGPCPSVRGKARRSRLGYCSIGAGLIAALDLHRSGMKVRVDLVDWFSEDLPIEARKGWLVDLLREVERRLLSCILHATCTAGAIADALAARKPSALHFIRNDN